MKKPKMKSYRSQEALINAWFKQESPDGKCRMAYFVGDKMYYGRPDLVPTQVAQRFNDGKTVALLYHTGAVTKSSTRLTNQLNYYTLRHAEVRPGVWEKRDIEAVFTPSFDVQQARTMVRQRISALYLAIIRSRTYAKEYYENCIRKEPHGFDAYAAAVGSDLRAFPENPDEWNDADRYAVLMQAKGDTS